MIIGYSHTAGEKKSHLQQRLLNDWQLVCPAFKTTRKQAEPNGRKRTRLRDSDPLFYLLLKKKQRKSSNLKLFRCSVTHLFIWISVISTCWRLAARGRFLIQKEIGFAVLADPALEKLLLIFGIRENPGGDQNHQ